MDAEQIKELAIDVNNVAEASFDSGKKYIERPLLAKIAKLEDELKASKFLCEKYRRIALERGPNHH